jgi:hypothetical protein
MDRTRASDAEREAAAGVLRAAAAEGRLETDELEDRVAAAYAAKTRGELTALLDDLPKSQLPAPRERQRKRPVVPGTYGFTARWRAPVRMQKAKRDLMEFVVPPLHSFGYTIVEQTAEQLVFERRVRPSWTYFVAVAVFPVGLLALLHETSERIVISVVDHGEDTTIIAQGIAPLRIRRALMELEQSPTRARTTP